MIEQIETLTKAIVSALKESGYPVTPEIVAQFAASIARHTSGAGRMDSEDLIIRGERINAARTDYSGYPAAQKGTDPKEVVIGVGPAFQREIKNTICGISLDEVLRNLKAGIEEEGMHPRAVKILKTSDVSFMGLEAAKLSGSGIGIGVQSKGTAIIHQRDLYPLTNLELFPQAPLMTLDTYRKIGRNAARYAKGEQVAPIPSENDPMVRATYQVKAAIMHIVETEQIDPKHPIIEWRN